jgi:hypothetical protein
MPAYLDLRLERTGDDRGRLSIGTCDALAEGDAYSWFALFDADPHPALDAMVQAVNPRSRCIRTTPSDGARYAWDVVVDRAAEAATPRSEVAMVENTGTARFAFVEPAISN